jgi:hypothetical protein
MTSYPTTCIARLRGLAPFAIILGLAGCRAQSSRSSMSQSDSALLQRARDSAFEALVMADVRRPFPTDSALADRMTSYQTSFDQLISMARTDSDLVRIAPDFTWTRTTVAWPRPKSQLGFTQARWDQYRSLFQALGLEAGLFQRPEDVPRVIYLLVQTKGLVTSGSAKGYAYSNAELVPRCKSLDSDRGPGGSGTCFKPLGHHWFLYLEWD